MKLYRNTRGLCENRNVQKFGNVHYHSKRITLFLSFMIEKKQMREILSKEENNDLYIKISLPCRLKKKISLFKSYKIWLPIGKILRKFIGIHKKRIVIAQII